MPIFPMMKSTIEFGVEEAPETHCTAKYCKRVTQWHISSDAFRVSKASGVRGGDDSTGTPEPPEAILGQEVSQGLRSSDETPRCRQADMGDRFSWS